MIFKNLLLFLRDNKFVMSLNFYQGEDIFFEVDCLSIDNKEEEVNIEFVDFMFIIYTDKNFPIKFCTKTMDGYLPLEKEGNTLKGKIPFDLTKFLKAGNSILEIKVNSQVKGWTSIGKIPFCEILPTQIRYYDIEG